MHASSAASKQATLPLNLSAAFAPFSNISTVSDGRNFHRLSPEVSTDELEGQERHREMASKLLETLQRMNYSLNAAMNQSIVDQRIATLYKENSQHEHANQKTALTARFAVQALGLGHRAASQTNRLRPSSFGQELPLLRSQASRFVLSSLERWATAAGLECFLDDHQATDIDIADPHPSGSSTALDHAPKKKVVVSMTKGQFLVDVEFECDPLADSRQLDLVQYDGVSPIVLYNVNVHHENEDGKVFSEEVRRAGSLQALLAGSVRQFLRAVGCASGSAWKSVDAQVAEQSCSRLKTLLVELNWLATVVEKESSKAPERGIEWSNSVLNATEKAILSLKAKTAELRVDLGQDMPVPLDILALRSFGIPIPYLQSFSLAFILCLPPLAYMMLQGSQKEEMGHSSLTDVSDVPIPQVRELASDFTLRDQLGLPVMTVAYHQDFSSKTTRQGDDDMTTSDEADMDYIFPSLSDTNTASGAWVASIDIGTERQPLILSQSRARRIASVLKLRGDGGPIQDEQLATISIAPPAGGPSWLDLAIDPACTQPSRVYTSRYQPKGEGISSEAKELDFVGTLTAVTEPGLAIGKIPIRSLKDVYAIIEIVKEQVWLQGLLTGAGFRPGYHAAESTIRESQASNSVRDGADITGNDRPMAEDEAKAMYEAMMNGSYVASRLRVTFQIIDGAETGVRLTFPLRGTIVRAEITLDLTLPKGIKVVVDGNRVEPLEEVARRGGLIGLALAIRRLALKRS